jgi:hypothetical protein
MTGTFTSFSNSLSMNKNGWVAFAGTIGGKLSVFVYDGTNTRLVANADNAQVSAIDAFAPAINSQGLVAFRGKEEDGDDAIFIGDGFGNLTRVIGENDTITSDLGLAQLGQETTSSPTFSGGIALNDSNQIAFTTGLHPNGNTQVEWGTAIYIASVPEPASVGVTAVGAVGLMIRRRRAR